MHEGSLADSVLLDKPMVTAGAANKQVAGNICRHCIGSRVGAGAVLIIVNGGPGAGAAGIPAHDPVSSRRRFHDASHVKIAIAACKTSRLDGAAALLKVVNRAPGDSAVGALADDPMMNVAAPARRRPFA